MTVYNNILCSSQGNDRDGVNIIYVIRSDKWGSSDDKVLVVGANYDTGNPETPGRVYGTVTIQTSYNRIT